MKTIYSSIFRALVAVAAGALMVKYDKEMVEWLTKGIGGLFFLSGIISLCIFYIQRGKDIKEQSENPEGSGKVRMFHPFPIVGCGSILLGIILIFLTESFIAYLVYAFAAILILGAINQYINLAMMIKVHPLHWSFWILPTIILAVGCICVYDPEAFVSKTLFLIPGIFMIVYGVTELLNAIQIHRLKKKYLETMTQPGQPELADIEEAEIIEETNPENEK